ncbi:MAG: Wzt carbohydrate-binding domain-containing protein, partial [Gammaproteobacteria bacterium]|nr:Wzt carbohydrate-binding domain-containing protein [Gammaproteobacteria bacterium]
EPYPNQLLNNHQKQCVQSGLSNLIIKVNFESDFSIKAPNFAVTITDESDFNMSSACTLMDNYHINRNSEGITYIELHFPKLNLLKGNYYLYAYLMCEQCIFIYESAPRFAEFEIVQHSNELGIVSLPHSFK